MTVTGPGEPLSAVERETPQPGPGELLLDVLACAVCRTDLHIADGELVPGRGYPLVPGHQVVARRHDGGARVGVPWLAWACGECRFCRSGRENLCERARFTGLDVDGGYATQLVADERFVLDLPEGLDDVAVAPLLCAGLIGFRAYRMCGDAARIGLYGFGAAAHLICQVALFEGRRVFAFTRAEDAAAQALALSLGAEWAGDALAPGPEPLDAAIIFAPVGRLVPAALRACDRGGVVVCAGIHMSDIPSFPYAELWEERAIRSVANLTRADGREFMELAPRVPVTAHTTTYALGDAQAALDDLRAGRLTGAAVLVP
jgi:propanol-preferring alcohol dehydrogenase